MGALLRPWGWRGLDRGHCMVGVAQEAGFAALTHLQDGPADENMAAFGKQLVSPQSTLATFGQARPRLSCATTDACTRKQSLKNRLCS